VNANNKKILEVKITNWTQQAKNRVLLRLTREKSKLNAQTLFVGALGK